MWGLIWAVLAVTNTIFFLMVILTGKISDGEQAIICILFASYTVSRMKEEWGE